MKSRSMPYRQADVALANRQRQEARRSCACVLQAALVCAVVLPAWALWTPSPTGPIGFGRIRYRTESAAQDRSAEFIKPSIPGRVTRVLVSEGDRVQAGTPLVELDHEAIDIQIETETLAVRSLEEKADGLVRLLQRLDDAFHQESQLITAQMAAAREEIETRRADRTQEIRKAQAVLVEARQQLERAEMLWERRAVAEAQLIKDRRARDVASAELAIAQLPVSEKPIEILACKLDVLKSKHAQDREITEAQLREARSACANRTLVLKGFEHRRARAFTIRACDSGSVTGVHVRPGDVVTPSTVLLTAGTGSEFEFEMTLAGDRIDLVRVGQTALIYLDTDDRFDAAIQGRVSFVAPDSVVSDGPASNRDARYVVRLDVPNTLAERGGQETVTLLGVQGHARLVTGEGHTLLTDVVDAIAKPLAGD